MWLSGVEYLTSSKRPWTCIERLDLKFDFDGVSCFPLTKVFWNASWSVTCKLKLPKSSTFMAAWRSWIPTPFRTSALFEFLPIENSFTLTRLKYNLPVSWLSWFKLVKCGAFLSLICLCLACYSCSRFSSSSFIFCSLSFSSHDYSISLILRSASCMAFSISIWASGLNEEA